jgi:hypothetical protein
MSAADGFDYPVMNINGPLTPNAGSLGPQYGFFRTPTGTLARSAQGWDTSSPFFSNIDTIGGDQYSFHPPGDQPLPITGYTGEGEDRAPTYGDPYQLGLTSRATINGNPFVLWSGGEPTTSTFNAAQHVPGGGIQGAFDKYFLPAALAFVTGGAGAGAGTGEGAVTLEGGIDSAMGAQMGGGGFWGGLQNFANNGFGGNSLSDWFSSFNPFSSSGGSNSASFGSPTLEGGMDSLMGQGGGSSSMLDTLRRRLGLGGGGMSIWDNIGQVLNGNIPLRDVGNTYWGGDGRGWNGMLGLQGGAGSGPGGFPFGMGGGGGGTLGALWNMGSGLYGMLQGNRLKNMAMNMQGLDPWGANRAGFASQAANLSPEAMMNDPAYRARQLAVERSMLAQGYQGSGNMAQALAQNSGDFFQQRQNQLAQLGGAGLNPAAMRQMQMQALASGLGLQGNALNRMGYGLLGMMG